MNKFVFRSKVKVLMTKVKEILTRVKEHMTKVKDFITKARGYVRVDGLLHILCVAILALSLFSFLPYYTSIIIAVAVAVSKELIYDLWLKKGVAEWHDIICDVAGLIYASIVYLIGLL